MDNLITISYFAIFATVLYETILVFRKMRIRTHFYLFMNCMGMLICNLAVLIMQFCTTDELYFYALLYSWLGKVWVIIATLYFVVNLCKYKVPQFVTVIESIISVSMLIVIITTRKTGLFYANYDVEFVDGMALFNYTKGPFYISWLINVNILVFTCIFVLVNSMAGEKIKRKVNQYKMIMVALISESLVGVLCVLPIGRYYDFNQIGFLICAIIIIVATFKNNLFDIETATKDYIVDDLSSGVVALDKYGDIAYYNRMIEKVFPFIEASPQDAIDHIHWLIERNQLLNVENKSYRFEEKQFEDERFRDMTIFAMTDVTAYYNHLKDMEKQKEIADEANKLKSFFLASMSHEIRTPINTVLGMDEMILLENKDPEINQYAKRIQSAGKTLLGIINDILDFSKIEAGKIEIVPVKYDVLELINDLVSNTQSLANDKGLSFEVDIDSHIPRYLIGDETRIKQCITNLLTNAIKYTEKGKVCLTIGYSKDASPDSVCLSVSVKDTGIGIKHEDMDKLFTAFDRLDVVRNRSIKGTGLGLAITKQYVDKMGSELCVESEYNKGSTFSFLLRQLVGGWEQIGEYKFDGNVYDDNKTDKYSVETFYAPAATVLVVDDTENNLFVFESLLKKTGLNIETAASAKQMLKMVTERKYDIIYLDHMMPEMDGIEALHAMEKVSGNMNMTTPVIALTANAIYGSRDFYLGEGFSDYMSKPVSYATLKASLEKYLPPEKKSHAEPIEVYNSNDEIVVISDELAAYEGRGIDVKTGIENSGSGVILLKVLKDFRESVEETANTIERELKKREMKNYTVHVHALKSSARLIGAMRLSAMALNLENIGNEYLNAVKENNTAKSDELLADIEEFTPGLLTYLRSFKELLDVGEDEESESTAEALPKISHEDLDEMLAAMKEFAQAFDMDNVDAVMETIVTYSIPDDKKSLIEELKKAVRNIDYDLIISLLSGV